MSQALQAGETLAAVTRMVPRRSVSLLMIEVDHRDEGTLLPAIARLIEEHREHNPTSRSATLIFEARP